MARHFTHCLICCIEPRLKFQNIFHQISTQLHGADRPSLAGASLAIIDPKTRGAALVQIELASKFHKIATVMIVEHQDCGAYKAAGMSFSSFNQEVKLHQKQFEKAKKIISRKFPKLKIIGKMALDNGEIIDL